MGLMAKKCWSIDKKAMRECELMHTIVESVQQRGRHLEHTRLVRSHHHRCFSRICIETEEKYQHFLAIIPISTAGRNLRSLTFVRDDNALSNALRHSLSSERKKNHSGNLLIALAIDPKNTPNHYQPGTVLNILDRNALIPLFQRGNFLRYCLNPSLR